LRRRAEPRVFDQSIPRLDVEALPVEVGQQRRQPREAVEEFARAGVVTIGGNRIEPFNNGQHTIDIRGKPLRRCARFALRPKLARVIGERTRQNGPHSLGVGANRQPRGKGGDCGVIVFHTHLASMSRGPMMVEAQNLVCVGAAIGRRRIARWSTA
jgi:hypothetical protein